MSVTSHRIDTQIKPRLYAAAAVPDYWVVDVHSRRLEVGAPLAGLDPKAS